MIPVKSGPRAAPGMEKGNVRNNLCEMVIRFLFQKDNHETLKGELPIISWSKAIKRNQCLLATVGYY